MFLNGLKLLNFQTMKGNVAWFNFWNATTLRDSVLLELLWGDSWTHFLIKFFSISLKYRVKYNIATLYIPKQGVKLKCQTYK